MQHSNRHWILQQERAILGFRVWDLVWFLRTGDGKVNAIVGSLQESHRTFAETLKNRGAQHSLSEMSESLMRYCSPDTDYPGILGNS